MIALLLSVVSGAGLAAVASAPAELGKARIVITSEPLGGEGVTADVEINGKPVASVGVEDKYSGVFFPGKIAVTVKGDKFEFDAEANKEYALEIALVPSRGGFFLFGMAGAMSMGTFKLTLKETKPLLAAEQQAESARESTATAKQAPEQSKPTSQTQVEPILTEKSTEKVSPPMPMQNAIATASRVDFNAEANKAARILGCQPGEIKVEGIEGSNILYFVACADSKMLNLSCDPTGLCLQKKAEERAKR
jgi:hypothetical protein